MTLTHLPVLMFTFKIVIMSQDYHILIIHMMLRLFKVTYRIFMVEVCPAEQYVKSNSALMKLFLKLSSSTQPLNRSRCVYVSLKERIHPSIRTLVVPSVCYSILNFHPSNCVFIQPLVRSLTGNGQLVMTNW